jgi:O-antigen ligase
MTRIQLSRSLILVLSAALLPLAVVSGPSLAVWLGLLVVASLLGSGISWPLEQRRRDPLLLVLLVFLAWAGATAIWSLSPATTLLRSAKLAWIVVALWVVLRAAAATEGLVPGRRRLLASIAFGTAAAMALVAVERASAGWFFEALGLDRPHPDPDIEGTRVFKGIAAMVVISWCLLPWLLARYGRALCLSAVSALGILVLWAGSLSAVLAFAAAVLSFALAWRFGKRFLGGVRIAVVTLVLLLPAAGLTGPAPFVDAVSAADSAGLAVPGSALHRAYIYDFVLNSIWQRPLIGWGVDAASLLPGAEQVIPSLQRNLLPSHPHNAVLEVWVEMGVVGAVLGAVLLWLVLGRVENGLPCRAERAAAFAAFAAYFVISLLSFSLWATWWLSVAVIAGFLFRALDGEQAPGRGGRENVRVNALTGGGSTSWR